LGGPFLVHAMPTPIYVVDAFALDVFSGNPAAVCLLRRPAPPAWMQRLAAEMKHAETAFVSPQPEGFRLRWFSPTVEVDLCGHATLAAAHILWTTGRLPRTEVARFDTLSGRLTATRRGARIELDFPAEPCAPTRPSAALAAAFPGRLRYVGRNRLDYLVEVDSARRLRALAPEVHAVAAVGGRGVIVTARSDQAEYDFLYRYFAPNAGVPEDAATGSVQCALAPYWADRLGQRRLASYQASARGGVLWSEPAGDRVKILGRGYTVLAGTLSRAPP
jgi:predicted PhzF superfamily epimerase YddE/YHI9